MSVYPGLLFHGPALPAPLANRRKKSESSVRGKVNAVTSMKRCINAALSGESYFIPSSTEVHARYHFSNEVLASC